MKADLPTYPVAAETFVWALHAMCRERRIAFEPALVLQQFPPPHALIALLAAGERLGLKTAVRDIGTADLGGLVAPFLAVVHSNQTPNEGEERRAHEPIGERIAAYGLVYVLRVVADQVVFIEPRAAQAGQVSLALFAARYTGQVVQFISEAERVKDHDAAREEAREFGFRWFVPELLKHRGIWRDVLGASLCIQLLALTIPLFTQIVIDKVVVHHTMNTLMVIGMALLAVTVFSAGMSWIRQYLVLHTGNRVDAVLGSKVFEHLFKLPLPYFNHRPTGVVVARLHGVETIREFVSGAAVTLLLDIPFLIVFLAIMFYYSWLLSLITIGILALLVAVSFVVTPVLRARLNEQFLLGARNQAFATEYVAGMETVKSLQMEPQLLDRYGDYLASYLNASFNTRQLANTYNVVATTLEQLLTISILCIGALLVMGSAGFTIGMLVAFQMFAGRLSQPMLRLAGLWQEFQQALIAVRRLGDIMNVTQELHSLTPSREARGQGRVEFRDVSFRYGEHLPCLYEHFNLAVEPGKCIALMGPSGAGKSTLTKLLQGFYFPTSGQVLVDGRDTRFLSANELRVHFGVVLQETMLFSGHIYDNLVLGNPRAGFEDVVRACKFAEIHEFIEQLPEGYQTAIGERGVGLSGGQKQRIAIARALLKRPRILIFDEATSNLDQATAEQFANTVNRLRGKVTMIFIAHQLPRSLRVDTTILLGNAAAAPDAGAQKLAER